VKTVLPGGIIGMGSGTVAAAHSAGSAVVKVTAQEHSTFASEIVPEKMDTGGAASTMAPVVVSSAGVGRTC
jgi:hypothetical protein